MSTAVYEELFRFLTTKTEDPEVQARQKLRWLEEAAVADSAEEALR